MAAEVVDHLAPPGVGGLGDAVHMDLALVVRAPSRRRCARERADGIAQDGESAVGADAVRGSRAPLLRADHRYACRFPVAVASSSIIAGARKRRRRDAANSLKLQPRGALPRQAAGTERRSRTVRAERLKAIVCQSPSVRFPPPPVDSRFRRVRRRLSQGKRGQQAASSPYAFAPSDMEAQSRQN